MISKSYISIRTKVTAAALLPVLLCVIIMSAVCFSSLTGAVNEAAKSEFLQIGQKYLISFENKISDALGYLEIVSSVLEHKIEQGMTDRAALQTEIMQVFTAYNLVDGSSVYFEPDMFDGSDADYIGSEYGTEKSGRICWYYYKDNGETVYLPEAMSDEVEFELPHYTSAKEANSPIYTDPVIYEVEGTSIPMFTITYPVQNKNGNFIGAVTVDVFLEDIYEMLQSEVIYETGYIIIANYNGRIVYSPRYEDVGRTREEAGLDYALSVTEGENFFFNAKSIINGEKTLITVSDVYIEKLDTYFYISVAAPVGEINAPGARLMTFLILFSVFIVGVIVLILLFIISKIIAPIKEITSNVNRIARGDYTARITGSYSSEFAIVKDSVNEMAESIEAYVDESRNSLNILKNIMDGLDAYIYVTVPDTGEILFINEKMKSHFNIQNDETGLLCFQVLKEGQSKTCSTCPCIKLNKNPAEPVVWEEYDELRERYYRNTDVFIDWIDGRKVHLQHSVDITDIKKYMNEKLDAERIAYEMKHEKEKAETAARAKSDFLARMSHEIRTPMNAVMGMSEIMLRRELPQDVYENALAIKSASVNLLSIINDILDFSKIESGKMEIIETEYQLPSLINDVISIIRVRLIDKPIQFAASVEPSIPASLIGDEIRIRQILINILSNAVKYTDEGFISLAVGGEIDGDSVTLKIDVADSGIGVKDEDKGKLFGDFVQIDAETNKGKEGTGLGLAITRNLCRLMGGDITLESEYGKGSTFTITLPQKFTSDVPFAAVETPETKPVLLYETRPLYKSSIIEAFDKLGVKYDCVDSIPALFEHINDYSYVFASSFMYGSINPTLSSLRLTPVLVLISDASEVIAPKDARTLALPAHSLSVANILNDVKTEAGEALSAGASFIAPDAQVLIVDDVTANLKVGEGLMMPYEMQITLCKSGKEALELVAENEYDLVFMDHMMPEMDGIETTGRIRKMEGAYFEQLPIIALTANAVSGVREMFVQNGMNDFLAKPIETSKLNSILEKWIPKDKQKKIKAINQNEEENDFIKTMKSLPELGADKAIATMGGSFKTYERAVRISIGLMPENIERLNSYIHDALASYAIEVHGIKGVLNNIGAYELGMKAMKLEDLSKVGDAESCERLHPAFMEELVAFHEKMSGLINSPAADKENGDMSLIADALPKIEEFADSFDSAGALDVLAAVLEYTYGEGADKAIAELKDALERFDFDRALDLIDALRREIDLNE